MASVLKVSQINTYIKSILDADINLKNIYVCGEISNFTNHYRTGHFYFTLKDDEGAVKAVMFKSYAQRLRFMPENGMKVLVRCSLSVYTRDGTYQLYCEDMHPEGVGELTVAFEKLKQRLTEEGLFDDEHKKEIPRYPLRIGVVTSSTGAAIQDIFNVISRRYPAGRIILEPVKVQGEGSAEEIAAAIRKFNIKKAADVLIVGRGGGSIEDLWAFNEELVARAVFESEIPVISAVGHETDFTICDFVSDLRAPTPSAAAELAVPDYREVLYAADKTLDSIADAVYSKIDALRLRILQYENIMLAHSPQKTLQLYSQCIDALEVKLKDTMSKKLDFYGNVLSHYALNLEATNPLKTLARGYAIVNNEVSLAVKSVGQVSEGDSITVIMQDGSLSCKVEGIQRDADTDRKE